MNQKVLFGMGLAVLVLGCSGVAYWLGRSGSLTSSVVETPASAQQPEAIDVEPSLKVGSRVEALSSEGWQPATIQAVEGDQVSIRYERESLGEERIDIRLIRKPESELVVEPAAPSVPITQTPASSTEGPTTPAAPPLGPRPATLASSLPIGAYDCALDTQGIVQGPTGTFADDEAQQWELQMELQILDDHQYGAFGADADEYTYDASTGRITWDGGVLADQPAQFKADTQTIVSSMGGQALTCTLRR